MDKHYSRRNTLNIDNINMFSINVWQSYTPSHITMFILIVSHFMFAFYMFGIDVWWRATVADVKYMGRVKWKLIYLLIVKMLHGKINFWIPSTPQYSENICGKIKYKNTHGYAHTYSLENKVDWLIDRLNYRIWCVLLNFLFILSFLKKGEVLI